MDILGRRLKLIACEYSLLSSFDAVRDVSVCLSDRNSKLMT